jgi:prepilin-type N-terminal cleavage/methylation domain-containing protein
VKASPGFTLLETLVALVILGLGLLLAAGGIRFGLLGDGAGQDVRVDRDHGAPRRTRRCATARP